MPAEPSTPAARVVLSSVASVALSPVAPVALPPVAPVVLSAFDEADICIEESIKNAAHSWHPLFFARSLKVEDPSPVRSLIIGNSFLCPKNTRDFETILTRLILVMRAGFPELPYLFLGMFLKLMLEAQLVDSVAIKDFGIDSDVIFGYMVARVLRLLPCDYEETNRLMFSGLDTKVFNPEHQSHMYLAYFTTKHAMDAFRNCTLEHLVRSKANYPKSKKTVKGIPALWDLPKGADAILTFFVTYPRELLQSDDEISIDQLHQSVFLENFMVSSRRFVGLFDNLLEPWMRAASKKRHPLRSWKCIGLIVRNTRKIDKYYSLVDTHPLRAVVKSIAREILAFEEVAQPQMLASFLVPRSLTTAAEDTLGKIDAKLDSFEFAAVKTSQSIQDATLKASQTMSHLNESSASIDTLSKKVSALLDSAFPDSTAISPTGVKAGLSEGVKKGVDASGLGKAISKIAGFGTDLWSTVSSLFKVLKKLLPFVLVPTFIFTTYYATTSSTNRIVNSILSCLSGIYLLSTSASYLIKSGLFADVMSAIGNFTRLSDRVSNDDLAEPQSLIDLPSSVWATLAMAFTSFGFSKAESKVDIFKSTCKDVQSAGKGLESLFKAVLSFITSFADDIKGWLGIETKVSDFRILSFVDDLSKFHAQFKSGVAPPSAFMLKEAMKLYETGFVYAATFKREGKQTEETILQRHLRTLEGLIADIKKMLEVSVLSREQPVSVVFMGAPGAGKTIFTRFLEKLFFEYETSKMDPKVRDAIRKVHKERPLSICYHKGQDFYWDAIAPSTMIVTMDDWLQREVQKGGDYAPLMDFIGMANTEPWAPRMAFSKEEKWISPRYVFASTNATLLHDETIKDADAVYRRIDFLIDLQLDKTKIVPGKFTLDAYTLTLQQWIPNRSSASKKGCFEECRTITPQELVAAMVDLRKRRILESRNMTTTMENIVDGFMTKEMGLAELDIYEDLVPAQPQMMTSVFEEAGGVTQTKIQEEAIRAWLETDSDAGTSVPVEVDLCDLGIDPDQEITAATVLEAVSRAVPRPFLSTNGVDDDRMWEAARYGSPESFRRALIIPEEIDLGDLLPDPKSVAHSYTPVEIQFQEPGAVEAVLREGLHDRTGLWFDIDYIRKTIVEGPLKNAQLNARKLWNAFPTLKLSQLGFKCQILEHFTDKLGQKLKASFFNVCGGVYTALLYLKKFVKEHFAIIAVVVGIVSAWIGYLYATDKPEGQEGTDGLLQQSSSIFQHAKILRVPRRPHNAAPKAGAAPQMGTDHFDAIRTKLIKNMFDLYGPKIDGTQGIRLGTLNGICDTIFHAPNHFMMRTKALWDAANLSHQHRNFFLVQGDKTHKVHYDDIKLLSDPEESYSKDRIIVQVVRRPGCTLPMVADVLKHYISDDEMGQAVYRNSTEFPICLFDAHAIVDEQKARYVTSRKAKSTYGFECGAILEEDLDVRDLFEYRIPTKQGDCGALLLSTGGTTARVLGGHVLGSSRSGYAYRITQDEIKRAVHGKMSEITKADIPDFVLNLGVENPQVVVTASAYDLSVHTYATDYKMETKSSTFTNSHLERYLGDGEPYIEFDQAVTDTSPAAYVHARAPYCQRIEESQQKQKQFETVLKECADAVAFDLKKIPWNRSHRFYDYKEAVLGIPGTRFQALDFGTSSGYPFMALGMTKKSLGTFSPEGFSIGRNYVPLYQRSSALLVSLANDVIPEVIYQDTLKVEWRSIEKAKIPRLVSSAPLDAIIGGRMCCGSFMHFMCDTTLTNETLIGFNPYESAQVYATQFLRFGEIENCACADYKGFDTDHTPFMMMLCADIINQVCGGSAPEKRVRENYIWSIANSKHIRGSVVEVWPGSMPSGNVLTAVINCLVNMILVRFNWLRANDYHLSCLPRFKENVVFRCLGDDNGVAVHRNYVKFFTEAYQAESVGSLGYRMTSATKGAELRTTMTKFTDLELLKRIPRWDEGRQQWVLPLRLSVILLMPMKTKKDNHLGVAKDNLDTALHELSLHDPQCWEDWAAKMIKFGAKDFSPLSNKRDFYLDRVLRAGYYDPDTWELVE